MFAMKGKARVLARVACEDVGCFVYLHKSKELRVVLHLPACELETVFFLPTVVLIGGEKLMELRTERKE